jgi:hypothetical protein
MSINKIIKLTALNLGIAICNIMIFSDGFLHIQLIGASAFSSAIGFTIIIMSLLIFAYGNYNILFEKKQIIQTSEIKTTEDYIEALERNEEIKVFSTDIKIVKEQIIRFQKKKDTINDILLQRFNSSEMSYSKFQTTIGNVEKIFFLNIKSILNKLNAFDETDYNQFRMDSAQLSKDIFDTKMEIFNEYFSFVKKAIEDDEEILLKLDKVLLEISKLDSLEAGELENMSAMQEIDELIQNTKWYK